MPTHITQIEDKESGKTILHVEGSMMLDDAILLEKIALDIRSKTQKNITLDFSDLNFLDSESAPILKRLEREHNFEITGLMIFLQKIIKETERN